MIIEQIYTGCLAQGAYYIQSGQEAAIIDPLREVQPYIEKAKRNNATIKYIFETHFHADFVSGHVDLAQKTGASIIYGPTAVTSFEATIAKDEELFKLGNITLRVLHTPGHTIESCCYLLLDENGQEKALFTGDTLFIGDVGRPDLAQSNEKNITQEDLAGMLYDSLQQKIMPLPDEVVIYPAHGAGSACGKHMSKETYDTLGNQKKTNYALKATSKAQFIKEVIAGLLPPPYYFPQNVLLNKEGYNSLEAVLQQGLTPLTVEDFEQVVNQTGALVLDTRAPQVFKAGFIPRAINIGIDGGFAPWVGTLITDIQQPIVIVAEEGREEEVITRLARVGYDRTLGYLKGGFAAWQQAGKEIDQITSVSAEDFAEKYQKGVTKVVDVRKESEYEQGAVEEAQHVPLAYINEYLGVFTTSQPTYIHCAAGYRSMIACSILKARGFENVIDIAGGFKAIAETNLLKASQE
ncbi:MAG: rhodanese-like domain-containing protein [Thermonemataceae bacterium]